MNQGELGSSSNPVSNFSMILNSEMNDSLLVREFQERASIGVQKMAINIWYRLILDRVHMSVTIASKTMYGILLGQFYEMKALQATILPFGKISICKKEYSTRLDYYPRKKGRKIADIEIGVTPSKQGYFRLGLYPSQFRSEEFQRLNAHLGMFFEEGFYEKMYFTSRVTYLELATDSFSHDKHSFIPFKSRANNSMIIVNKDGSKGSTYIGGLKSQTRYCIYDKAKQLLDTKQYDCHQHATRTRIEARMRHVKLSPYELFDSLPNPLAALEIAELKTARELNLNEPWHQFLDDCEVNGSASALAKCTKNVRKINLKMLRDSAATWWNPAYAWKGLEFAAELIKPG